MPYLPKKERERQKWMTLPEAVAHIREAEQCDADTALAQLRTALADGEIKAYGWTHRGLLERDEQAPIVERIIETLAEGEFVYLGKKVDPYVAYSIPYDMDYASIFWTSVSISLDGQGFVLDKARSKVRTGLGFRKERYVCIVSKAEIAKIWTIKNVPQVEETNVKEQNLVVGKVEIASQDDIQTAARVVYDKAKKEGKRSPNMIEAEGQVLAQLSPKKAPRKLIRRILIQPEFANRRLRPGRPRLTK